MGWTSIKNQNEGYENIFLKSWICHGSRSRRNIFPSDWSRVRFRINNEKCALQNNFRKFQNDFLAYFGIFWKQLQIDNLINVVKSQFFWWLFSVNNFETYQDDKVVTKSKTIKKLDKIVAKKKLDIMLDIQMADGKIFLVF